MIVVDSHCHVSPYWFEPVESLLYQMDRYEVQHAILIQDSSTPDNDYQQECVKRFPGRFASVVWFDYQAPDAIQKLERLVAEGAVGVRLRQTVRSPGADPYAIWRAADRLGISVSCSGRASYYLTDDFAALVQEFPDLPIVIEHLGSGNKPDAEAVEPAVKYGVFNLARFPNVSIKIHGMGEFARRMIPTSPEYVFERPIPPMFDLAYEKFGPDRMMWGSDYPPVAEREGFGNALKYPLDYFADKPEEERAAIFGGTALRIFPVQK